MPSMPVYRWCSGPPEEWNPGETDYLPGRVLCPQDVHAIPREGNFLSIMGGLEGLTGYVGPNDVLGIQLYQGAVVEGREPRFPVPQVNDYAELLDVIGYIGPKIAGVMVGNQGLELSWRHLHGQWHGNAQGNIDMICAFVREVGETLRDYGAVPYFAVMDWDLIQDAYLCGWKLQEALHEVGAINYCACGYSLIPGAQHMRHDMIGGQQQWLSELEGRGRREVRPDEDFPTLRSYLTAGRHWSGLGSKMGVLGGNIDRLASWGFTGGVVALRGSDLIECDRILGDSWR